MLCALSLEGLSHLKPSQSTSYLVWPSSVWPSESARLPLLISTACCCGFLHVFGVYRCACMTEHMVCFFFPPSTAFPSCGCCSPRYGHHTGQEQRGQYPLCTHTCACACMCMCMCVRRGRGTCQGIHSRGFICRFIGWNRKSILPHI